MGYVVSAAARVLAAHMPQRRDGLGDGGPRGPFWAAALLGPLLGWASPLPLQRTRQGGIHLLPVLLADLP